VFILWASKLLNLCKTYLNALFLFNNKIFIKHLQITAPKVFRNIYINFMYIFISIIATTYHKTKTNKKTSKSQE